MTEFKIGDTAFLASASSESVWIQCPECLGTGRMRVILADESEHQVECTCCERGYEGSPGRISTYRFIASTSEVKISGVESDVIEGVIRTRYKHSGCYISDSKNLFATREEAENRCAQLIIEHEADEKKRLGYKEKQSKTWAWHVIYHRREIKRAQQQIEYHTAKLNVASKLAKEKVDAR